MSKEKLKEFEPLFYPRSIAVVGASESRRKPGGMTLSGMFRAGFKGAIYPINSNHSQIMGLKAYPNLRSVPGAVDYVTVHIPRDYVLDLLDECAEKGAKFVHFFTAGFSEAGDEDSKRREVELVTKARRLGIRIVGPNCLGVCCPAAGTSLMGMVAREGEVAIVSQSGGNADLLVEAGLARGFYFSKVVSFGNGYDLDSVDYLEYLAVDPDTRVIGMYLEGVRDGRRLWKVLRETARIKPVAIWKGGQTEAGAEAAFSHTASVAGSGGVWAGALRQAGVIKADNLDELADTLLAFRHLPPFTGRRVAVITGVMGGGGGASVASTDACVAQGLEVPRFHSEMEAKLRTLLPLAGSIFRNPLDISQARGRIEVLTESMRLMDRAENIDAIIFCAPARGHLDDPEAALHWGMLKEALLEIKRRLTKPLAVFIPQGKLWEGEAAENEQFIAAGIPVYPALGRAARAIFNHTEYYRLREGSGDAQG